jgi:hypothetical protein
MRKSPQRDPIRSHQRKAVAARRVGKDARCACGEARPEALITNSKPLICANCQRKNGGQNIMDDHHPAGAANSPVTIPVPVNDHRAELSTAQYDWPRNTLENPNADDLLKIAASLRGFIDTQQYLLDRLLHPLPEILEMLNEQKHHERNTRSHVTPDTELKQTADGSSSLSDERNRETQ